MVTALDNYFPVLPYPIGSRPLSPVEANTMNRSGPRVNFTWWALAVGLWIRSILSGIDEYFNSPTDWRMYLNQLRTSCER